MRRTILPLILLSIIGNSLCAQTSSEEGVEIYLVNSMDTTKKVHLKNGVQCELLYEFGLLDTLIESKSTYLLGTIESISDTSVTMNPWSESAYITYFNGDESEVYTTYTSQNKMQLSINQIEYLQYSSPTRDFLHNFGTTTASLAALTALIVAPLVSINFKNGDFKKNTYYRVAGYSLIGLGVSIPIIALTKPKQYLLLEKDTGAERDYWYLESNPTD